jgi:hypothetical protein
MRPSWISVQNTRVVIEADLLWRCRARVRVLLGRWEAQRIVASGSYGEHA